MRVVRLPPGTAQLLVYRNGGRDKLSQEGRCRLCERPSHLRQLTKHHLVPKSWMNRRKFYVISTSGVSPLLKHRIRDCDPNVIPLCAPCHSAVEKDEHARRILRKKLAPVEAALAIKLRGQEWFDQRYPKSAIQELLEHEAGRHRLAS